MIYIVGGEIHNRVFNSVRRFNFESNMWDEVAPMNKHRDGVGVAVYSGHIYAAGGRQELVIRIFLVKELVKTTILEQDPPLG